MTTADRYREQDAKRDGYVQGLYGEPKSTNPRKPGTGTFVAWLEGWTQRIPAYEDTEGEGVLIIWKDWDGDLYAFCSRECLEHYKKHVTDPSDLEEKATSTEHSFGCWWCGGDLAEGVTWLPRSEPEA